MVINYRVHFTDWHSSC